VTNPHTGQPGLATIHVGSGDYVVQRIWVNSRGGYCGFGVTPQGDFDGDGRSDLITVQRYVPPPHPKTLNYPAYLGISRGDGTFTTMNTGAVFDGYSKAGPTISGNFEGNGRAELAATNTTWNYVPTLYNNASNSWYIGTGTTDFNQVVASGSPLIAMDLIGDGTTMLAALNQQTGSLDLIFNWFGTPGQWSSTYTFPTSMTQYAYAPFVVTGDFNGDGRDDIAATGISSWTGVPVAINNGDGTFNVVNLTSWFSYYAGQPGAHVVVGDFDGDGLDDLLTDGGVNWGGFLLALARGDGGFNLAFWSSDLSYYATLSGNHLVAGDFDGDGRSDLTVVGQGMTFVPVAFSDGAAYFRNATTSETTFNLYSSSYYRQTISSWLSGPYR
jgi:hypothetical protein